MDVAVLDPLPLFRQGVLAALGGGTGLESASDLHRWMLNAGEAAVLLLTLHDEESWAMLEQCGRRAGLRTVAMLPAFSVIVAANALRAGAAHVVSRQTDGRDLGRIVDQVVDGNLTLPLTILRAAIAARPDARRAQPADEELHWLRALAGGTTVAELALADNYSERSLHRRLKELYRRLGVENRREAMILARDEGWF